MTGPLYPFMREYTFINHQGTNTRPKTYEDERMNMILTLWPPIVWDFSKYKIMKNLARTSFPFLL